VRRRELEVATMVLILIGACQAQAFGQVQVRVSVTPKVAKLGERVIYRGRAILRYGLPASVKWLPPEESPDLTWGEFKARRVSGQVEQRLGAAARRPPTTTRWDHSDTLDVEVSLQAFRTGSVTIPGLRFQDQDPDHPTVYRLPAIQLIVAPVLSAADSNADLRPPRGPLAAPWWERVSWMVIAAVAGGLMALLAAIVWLRRRRKPAAVPAPKPLDPVSEALAGLASLKRLKLPEAGRFAEHAFQLTRILRRFLEATAGAARPGHSTTELVAQLERAHLDPQQVRVLERLLRSCDRVKFARASSSVDASHASEQTVEALVRHLGGVPTERAA